jgi:hypothetical protein
MGEKKKTQQHGNTIIVLVLLITSHVLLEALFVALIPKKYSSFLSILLDTSVTLKLFTIILCETNYQVSGSHQDFFINMAL